MSKAPRIFVHQPLEPDAIAILSAAAGGHVSRVLRLEAGDSLTLFDGGGGEYSATLTEVRGATVKARTAQRRAVEKESALKLTLVQGVSRGERMDLVVQKATELGVARIVPVITERSVVRLDEKQTQKKQSHWRGIAIAACEQCGRNRLPDIAAPLTVSAWLKQERAAEEIFLTLDPEAAASLLATAQALHSTSKSQHITLLIGPEGGLTESEIATAKERGFTPTRLGPRILRTETAALAALAVLQAIAGDLS